MGEADRHSKKRILVGEDSEESLLLIMAYLKSLDVECHSAMDGETVLRLASSQHFDLLLIDIGLPILSGLDVVKKLREDGLDAPIISISANSEAADLEEYRAAGFTDTLAKPFNRKQFINKVSALLEVDSHGEVAGSGLSTAWDPIAVQFAEQLPAKLKELYEKFEAQDYPQLAFLAHRVRAAAMFGFLAVSEIGAEIDAALKEGDHAKIPALLEKLSGAVDEIKRARTPLH